MNYEYTKVRTVTVKKKDVFFDIDYLTLYNSELTAGEAPVKADRIATESSASGGNRILTRLADHRVSDIRQLAEKFMEMRNDEETDNSLESTDWTFTFRMPFEVEDNIFPVLADLFHEYIVNGTVADWYAQIGVNGNREVLQSRANDDLARIRELIYHRPMP